MHSPSSMIASGNKVPVAPVPGPSLDQGRPAIIALASNEWHTPWWMARQHLYSRLAARGWPVVYSTGPQDVWLRNETKWQKARWLSRCEQIHGPASIQSKGGGIWLDCPGKLLPRYRKFEALDTLAVRRFRARLKRVARSISDGVSIAHVWHPKFWPIAKGLGAKYVVFHIHDAYDLGPGWCEEWKNSLEELVQRADLIITVAEHMARRLPHRGGERARLLPHGVDVRAMMDSAQAPCPADLASIPRPRIGYVGRVNPKIDFEGVAKAASARPEWSWVFVGAVGIGDSGSFEHSSRYRTAFEDLRRCPNVFFLGVKDRRDVPAYLNHMDINALYYSGWGVTGHPTKLYEYLAAGKPIVATDYEGIRQFSRVVDLVTTPEEWIDAIERALEHGGMGTVSTRQALALESTWDKRCDQLEAWLLELTSRVPA